MKGRKAISSVQQPNAGTDLLLLLSVSVPSEPGCAALALIDDRGLKADDSDGRAPRTAYCLRQSKARGGPSI